MSASPHQKFRNEGPFKSDLERNPGIGQSKGSFATGIKHRQPHESVAAMSAAIPMPAAPDPGYGRGHDHGYRKRKKSFLEELFD